MNLGDSLYFVFRKAGGQGVLALKFDSALKLVDSKEFRVPETLQFSAPYFFVKNVIEYQNYIYLITTGTDFTVNFMLKTDLDLNLIWSKALSLRGLENSLVGIGNNIFTSGLGDDGYIHRISTDGNSVYSKRIPGATAHYLINTIAGDDISSQLLRNGNNLIMVSNVDYPGVDNYTHLLLMKFDTNFNILQQKDISLSPGEFFGLSKIGRQSLNNIFYIECKNAGITEFMNLVLDNQFNIIRTKHWYARSLELLADQFKLHNRFCFGNECFNIYESLQWFPWSLDNRFDFIFLRNSFFTRFRNYANYKVPVVYTNTGLNNRVDIVGMSKNAGTYNYFQVIDKGNWNLNYQCGDCFVEIAEIENNLSNFACENLDPVIADSALPQTFIETIPQFYTENETSYLADRPLNEAFVSVNQYQVCGPAFDTCANLFVKILEDSVKVCAGRFRELHVLSREAANYTWFLNGQTVSTDSAFGTTYNTPGIFNVKVVVNPGGSLLCSYSDSITVTVNPVPQNLLNDTLICKGDTTQLNINNATSVIWIPGLGLSCDTCLNPTVVLQDSQRYVLNAVNQFGCGAVRSVNINVYPKPDATISGSNTVCPGITDVWFGLNPMDSFFASWWIDTIGIITQDFGDSIYTTWPQGIDSAFVYAYVQYPAGCEGDSIRFKVKVNQLLEPKILVNEDSICYLDRENETYNLSYNTNGSIYLWEIENGQILSGDSTASIIVNWDSVGTGKLVVREYSTTNIDTCFGADSIEIEILPNPENNLMLTGKEDVCLEENVSYAITSGWINSTYDWIASGSSNLTGNGSESIVTRWNSIGDYLVSVEEVSEYGCRGSIDSLEVIVHPIPVPQRIGEDTLLCLDELGNQNYEVSGFVNSSFNWTIEGGMIKSGQGTEVINVTWDSSLIKSLEVIEISEFGCVSEALQIKQYFDLSRLELFVVSVSEDRSLTLDFELESLRSYPGDSIWIARRSEILDPDPGSGPGGAGTFGDWVRIVRIPKTSTDYIDQSINPNESSFGYRVEGKNTCEQEIKSRDHASILLTGKRTDVPSEVSVKEQVELNWTAYRNWDGGVKTYELYKKFDSVYVKVSEANQTELTYDPRIPKKEHCFRIRAVQNGDVRESWSNAFCIELERRLNIPNVVTPNGDNKNDKLQIENLEAYPEHQLTIYNRWGQEVFKSNQYNNNWPEDNTISGTYFYRMQISDEISGMEENYKGWVQVLR